MSDTEANWERLDNAHAHRVALLGGGYVPIPLNGKKPAHAAWESDVAPEEAEIASWKTLCSNAFNTGILTKWTPAIDIDVTDGVVANAIADRASELVDDENAPPLVRFGRHPKRAILFRTDEPFKKLRTADFVSPDGSAHHVEVLCDGQQLAAFGRHPDTGRDYEWPQGAPGSVKHGELPVLTRAMAEEFIAAAADIMRGAGWREEKPKPASNGAKRPTPSAASEAGYRERQYAKPALEGCAADVANTSRGGRNDALNKAAFRLGTMIARGWIARATVEEQLYEASVQNGYIKEKGAHAAQATIKSGLDAGLEVPHADLENREPDQDRPRPKSFRLAELDTATAEAVNDAEINGDGSAAEDEPDTGPALKSARASTFELSAIQWIWPNRFAAGKLGILGGLPDQGKGQVLADMAARVTQGDGWPCGEGQAPQGNVILLTAEDDPSDTVVPRLIAAGADLDRVEIVSMVRDNGRDRMFSLTTDLDLLRKKIAEVGNVKMIQIDPISAYLGVGKVDSFRTTDVRAVLAPLVELAAAEKVSIVGIMHFNKKTDVTNAMLRISDSLAFVATARHCYVVIDDQENGRKLFMKAKNNLAPETKALAYGFGEKEVGEDRKTGEPIYAPHIVWHPKHVDVTTSEAMQADTRSPAARDDAKKFLADLLAAGPVPAQEIEDAAEANCISARTLRRAKKDLHITAKKDGPNGSWRWHLPGKKPRWNDDD